jgi:hypothetical protein
MTEDGGPTSQMDEAAAQAEAEIAKNFSTWTAKDVGKWWEKHFTKAGHKRLGRIVVKLSKA